MKMFKGKVKSFYSLFSPNGEFVKYIMQQDRYFKEVWI